MQFPVPQFTDVEDRIIGSLTIKQFGIVFAAGATIFGIYSLTKNVLLTIVVSLFLGLPSIALAFGRLNGRPLYSSFGPLFGYLTGGRLYVFQKQAVTLASEVEDGQLQVKTVAPEALRPQDAAAQLKQLQYTLQQKSSEEATVLEQISKTKRY
jgi:hypothetical protein